MPAIPMTITNAGLEAIVNAQLGAIDAVTIAEIGLTATPFIMAPTLTALPGEFRRLDTVAGQAVSETVMHVTAYDAAAIIYDVTGFGLYDDDGVLIAAYSAASDPVLSKAQLATSLFALDIGMAADQVAVIEFGAPVFTNPPATETTAGVAQIADNAEADAGVDDATIMSPKKVKRLLDALLPPGIISMWSGSIASIPVGWHLCDGTDGTPDLTEKFIIGAGYDYDPGDTGGAASHDHGGETADHTLTIAEIPEHDHPNGVGDQITTSFVYSTVPASSVSNMNNDAGAGTFQGLTGQTGGGTGHSHDIATASNLPPFYALAFIMRV